MATDMKPTLHQTPARRFGKPMAGWRRRLYTVIFEADTVAGKRFDIALLLAIVASVLVAILDSVPSIHARVGDTFLLLELVFTLCFTVEYILRLVCVRRPLRYMFSLFGLIDLVAILPTYLAFFLPGVHYLIDIRLLRLLRVFRVLKIPLYFDEAQMLLTALAHARRKILVFIGTVGILVVILGTIMYVIEGPTHGFTSIPVSMYWAVVTLTTTGYGDLTPQTALGQMLTSFTILLGYGIIALPTGIVGAELAVTMLRGKEPTTRTCEHCLTEGHDADADFCKHCGDRLAPYDTDS
jgi:voltage-gated potassium channel